MEPSRLLRPGEAAAEQSPIEVRGASKSYGSIEAVRGISFEVRPGEVFGLLGPNGAGKTTTIEMVCGLLRPDRGTIRIFGLDIDARTRDAQRLIGYSPQPISLFPLLTVEQNVAFAARLHDVSGTERRARVREVLATLELASLGSRPCSNLSGGEQRRVQLAMALAHRPPLLILDEPTAGVDVVTRALIQRLLRAIRQGGTSILYTTHYLEEAQQLCDRVAIVNRGSIVASDEVDALIRRHGTGVVEFGSQRPLSVPLCDAIRRLPGVSKLSELGPAVAVSCKDPDSVLVAIIEALHRDGNSVTSVKIAPPSLEGAFFAITGELYGAAS
jgi:ABC-type multidrug transport system ATPase subunit